MHFMERRIKLFIMLQNLALTLSVRESNEYLTTNRNFENDEYVSKHDINSDNSYDSDDKVNDKDIVSLLEERYKFLNDNTSTRYQIRNDERIPGKEYKIYKFLVDDCPFLIRQVTDFRPTGMEKTIGEKVLDYSQTLLQFFNI